jgi:hypothetical protein
MEMKVWPSIKHMIYYQMLKKILIILILLISTLVIICGELTDGSACGMDMVKIRQENLH